jgi:hypothetical protein
MLRERTNVRLYRPMIAGTMHITSENPLQLLINVKQMEEWSEDSKVKKAWRYGIITGDIEPMVDMEFYDGMFVPGKVKVVESFNPPVPEEPEEFIKRDKSGNICRIDGKVVYRTEQYTNNPLDEDELI